MGRCRACAEMCAEEGGDIISPMDTGCYKATQRHERPHNTADTKVHCFSPFQSKPVYFRPVTQKPQRHAAGLISAHIPFKTRRAPQNSSLALRMPLSISSTKTVFRSQSGRWELITEFLLHSPRFEIWIRRATSDWITFADRAMPVPEQPQSIGHFSGLTAPAA